MKILSLNNIRHWKTNIVYNLTFWLICSVAEFGIVWAYNIWNGNTSFGVSLHWMLKNSEWTITIPIIAGLFGWYLLKKNLTKNIVKIVSLIIVTHVFVFADFDNLVFRDLWDVRGYPSVSIFFNFMNIPSAYQYFVNIPPIDPFQMIMLSLLSLFRNSCEKGLDLLIEKANFRKYMSNII